MSLAFFYEIAKGDCAFATQAHDTCRGAAVASLVVVFENFSSGLGYFYVRCVQLAQATVSSQTVAKTINKGATAPSAK